MDILLTDKTYSTPARARIALRHACDKFGKDMHDDIRYVIAVNQEGRFAPIVIGMVDRKGDENVCLIHAGITVAA